MENSPATYTQEMLNEIVEFLSARDPVIAKLIESVGSCRYSPGGDYFSSLVESMVYQQVTGKAAEAIYGRLVNAAGEITPEALSSTTDSDMRNAGLSRQKISYIRDLSEKSLSGEINLDELGGLNDPDIISALTSVRGIGLWTAQMFLIFTLGRMNVLPLGDLGIRRAIERRYSIRGKLTDAKIEKIGKLWSPYRTIAVIYLWEAENMKLPANK